MKLSEINWGDDSAEKDPYLLHYFVQSPAFQRLKDKQKTLVVGRKGSGKSAVRKKLEQVFSDDGATHVVNLSPKFSAIRNILNDADLSAGFGEEIFFQHTWIRQILLDCLCLVGHSAKGKYASESVAFARDVSQQLNRTSKDIVENISDVLSRIKAKVGHLGDFGLSLERELRNVADVDALEHHFREIAGSGANFVVLIDDLDLGWNNSPTANNLLLGLLSAINHLSSLSRNMFLCVFLREDVYAILITKTQHSDKYRNVERLRWEKEDLMAILSERINFNREKNGLKRIAQSFPTVFPANVGTTNCDNWLYERTLGRPRELIQLSRYYTESVDSDSPSDNALKASEQSYSEWKLDDLCTEYSNQYSGLVDLFTYWKTNFFRVKYHLKRVEIDEMLLKVLTGVELNAGWFNDIAGNTDVPRLLQILYEIGFIGDFVQGGEGGSRTLYSYQGRHEPRFEEVQIHPCFRRAVGTVERIRTKGAAGDSEGSGAGP
jgi:energy-coupling factor transporter ATP-binding protein EcfA2